MFGHIAKQRVFGRLSALLAFSYGELSFTTKLQPQAEFAKIPTFRAIDLEGRLLDKSIPYDTQLLTKVLKTMIFVDEMDSILLKVKSQGKISFYMTSFG